MNEHSAKEQEALYSKLLHGFGDFEQLELNETAFEALDRILELNENDLFFCEISCLGYAAHVLTLDNGPKELWIIAENDSICVTPRGMRKSFVEWMANSAEEIVRGIGGEHRCFKGFASAPPDEPYKLLITTNAEDGVPTAGWPEMTSYFHHHLSEVGGSKEAVIYPPLDEQPKSNSLREGSYFAKGLPWIVELSSGRIIIGYDDDSKVCRMVDLSDAEHPWEIEASPFTVAACGGCFVPSMCRQLADSIGETSLGELATRISRGTSLSRKTLNPYSHKATKLKPLLYPFEDERYNPDNGPDQPEEPAVTINRDGSRAREGDLLYLDSSCINAGKTKPLFIDDMPKGQERYTVTPEDGEVLLFSRNEKRFVFYEAPCPTLIANSVYIVWLNSNVDNRFLECWLEGTFAERWLKTAGQGHTKETLPNGSEPILSKGTLSSLPVPVMEERVARQTVARKDAILHRIGELYCEIAMLESREAFAPASAMADPVETIEDCQDDKASRRR